MTMYRDRNGTPITMMQWARLHATDYKQIALTVIGEAMVSTVWLGLNHGPPGGPDVFFETMIFPDEAWGFQQRYTTEAEAIAGHEAVCEQVRAGTICPMAEEPS